MEEAVGEAVEASQGLAAKIVLGKIQNLLGTLNTKAKGPLVSSAACLSISSLPLKALFLLRHRFRFPGRTAQHLPW